MCSKLPATDRVSPSPSLAGPNSLATAHRDWADVADGVISHGLDVGRRRPRAMGGHGPCTGHADEWSRRPSCATNDGGNKMMCVLNSRKAKHTDAQKLGALGSAHPRTVLVFNLLSWFATRIKSLRGLRFFATGGSSAPSAKDDPRGASQPAGVHADPSSAARTCMY